MFLMNGGFLLLLRLPPPNKVDRHDITEIFLKVELNTLTPTITLKGRNKWITKIYYNVRHANISHQNGLLLFSLKLPPTNYLSLFHYSRAICTYL
jgi:hypothetical protein